MGTQPAAQTGHPLTNTESSHPSMSTFESTPTASEFSAVSSPPTKLPKAPVAPAAAEQPVQHAADLKAEVFRLTITVSSWKRHDQRSLVLSKGHLHVYEKGSDNRVKTIIEVSKDVAVCSLLGNGIMSLQVLRPRRRRLLPVPLSNDGDADKENKVYLF